MAMMILAASRSSNLNVSFRLLAYFPLERWVVPSGLISDDPLIPLNFVLMIEEDCAAFQKGREAAE
jgi:hypothetical protein